MRNFVPFILGLILFLALALRLLSLSSVPPGLTWDEAALGYNAYSILQTGKDEYGNFLPLNLKSYGDYKPAVYAYIDVPFIGIFGLNETSVRLPSVLFGVLSVFLIFYLVRLIFKNESLAFLSSFFLAISPWHILFSRPAYEANVALFLNILGVYLLIKGFKKSRLLILSALVFGISMFTYQGSRIFVPIIILTTFLCFKDNFKKSKDSMLAIGTIAAFVVVLFFSTFLTGQTQRLNTLNFFAYRRSAADINLISTEDGLNVNSLPFQILHGEWFSYAKGLVERYVIYFSPKALFIDGDYNQRQRVPDLGLLYYFSILLIPFGVFKLLKNNDQSSKLIIFWLLVSPIPGVLSRDLITSLRALNMIVPWVIIDAAGLVFILSYLRKLNIKVFYIGSVLIGFLIFSNFVIFLDRYFIHAPVEYSRYWLYGYKQVFNEIKDLSKYNKVVITDKMGQPYIYYLFYTKYPPEKFQKQAKLDQPTVDVGTVRNIDNIEFRNIYWPKDRAEKNSLFVGLTSELPDQDVIPFPEYRIVKDINFLDAEPGFRIVEVKP